MSDALNKVSDRIKNLAAAVEKAIEFDDDGAATLPETWVEENLSEALTMEQVKAVQSEESNMVGALALGLGNATQKQMGAKKDLDRTSLSTTFGHNVIKTAVDRRVVNRIPSTGEEKAVFGNVTVKLESGAAAKRGDLKRIRSIVADNFAAEFAK